MLEWFNNLNDKVQIVIISSITSFTIFIIGGFAKFFYERSSLSFKLKKEYEFEQKKKLKEEIAKNKVPLLNIVEDLNHRLWNFKSNIDKKWHNITLNEWEREEKYYIRSFVYRFLVLIHWITKIEQDTTSIDSTIADKDDLLFLKYIKAFKNLFCNTKILKELDYKNDGHNTNHFFKDDLIGYANFIRKEENILDFDEFKNKSKKNYDGIKDVISYFSNIQDSEKDKNLNILMCFHLLAIIFLNKFGHTYQKSNEEKINHLTSYYNERITIKKGFKDFIEQNKLDSEMNSALKSIS